MDIPFRCCVFCVICNGEKTLFQILAGKVSVRGHGETRCQSGTGTAGLETGLKPKVVVGEKLRDRV